MMEKCLSSLVVVCWLLLAGIANGQSSNRGRHCNNLVPGLDKMRHGIDITTFDYMSSGQEGLKRSVIEFTCNRSRGKTVNAVPYDLPDQIDSVTDLPGGIANSQNTLVTSYSEARRVISANFGVSGTFGKFGFSASSSLRRMQNTIATQSRFVSFVFAQVSASKAFMVNHAQLHADRDLQNYVDNELAADFEPRGNPTAAATYRGLIRNFGTHYFEIAQFGGLLVAEEHVQNEYLLNHSEVDVSAQAQASFASVFGVSTSASRQTAYVDSQYTQMSLRTERYLGGTTRPEGGSLQAWQASVTGSPGLFKGQLVPITSLIRDSGKRQALDRAIEDYMLRASLEEMLRLLATRPTRWSSPLVNQVNAMKTRPLLTVDIVQPLTENILLHFGPAVGDWTEYRNKYYALVTDQLTWAGAKERCERMNSHLVTIEDAGENNFVYNLVQGKAPSVWLGLTNRETGWTWVYGQPLGNYQPWAPSQPDGSGTCATLFITDRPYPPSTWTSTVNRWDDAACTNNTLHAVCESAVSTIRRCGDWQVYQGNCYKKLDQELSWDDAKTLCVSMGAQMVSIHSSGENDFVKNLIKGRPSRWVHGGSYLGAYAHLVEESTYDWKFWLGMDDIQHEGEWMLTDGRHVTYTNWDYRQPNNYGARGEENCAYIDTYGNWNDVSCYPSYRYHIVCKK